MLVRRLVSLAQSFIQPTEAPAGLVNQAQRHSFRWRTFPSVIKTTERRLGMKEPSSEPQMGETLGLARQAARPTRFEAFLLPIRITALLWVSLAQCSEQPMEGTTGSPRESHGMISSVSPLRTRIMGRLWVTVA